MPSLSNASDKFRSVAKHLPIDAQKAGEVLLSSVNWAIDNRWAAAKERAKRLRGDSVDDKVKALAKLYAQEMGTVGAVAGAAAAVPAVGTAAALSAGVAEFGWFTVRTSELILTIAALHGHSEVTVEERRAWILSVLVFGNGATAGFTKMAGELGKGMGKKATTRIPRTVISRINSSLGRTIVTKYGTKRGVIALGTALPFGIGAVVGGSANYAGVRLVAGHANKFFENLPYETVVADAIVEV